MGNEHPDWLPLGWRVSVKARSSGKKDKYYINPSTGLKFNSKPEVLRYIKSSGKDRKPKELKKIDIEKSVAKKLPPGWIKKIRTKKTGGRTRRDPYYIDPVSGRHFRSIPEVFRYLASEDARKAECNSEEILTGHKGVKSGGLKLASGALNNVIMEKDNHLEQKGKHDSLANELSGELKLMEESSKVAAPEKVDMTRVADDSVAEKLPEKLPQVNAKGQHNGGRRQRRRLTDIILRDNVNKEHSLQSAGSEDAADETTYIVNNIGLQQSETEKDSTGEGLQHENVASQNKRENMNMLEDNGLEQREKENNSTGEGPQHENVARQYKRRNPDIKRTSDLPLRTSKRLAHAEVDPLTEAKPSKTPDESEVSFNDSNDHSLKSRTGNIPTDKKQKRPIKPNKGDVIESKEDEKHEKHLEESPLKDLLMDPCIEFAIKTLTGAIPIEDVTRVGTDSPVSSLASPNQTSASSSSVSPSVDIWADPCFEFAVKTLTGDIIPMGNLMK